MKNSYRYTSSLLIAGLLSVLSSCELDQVNPNAATDADATTTREGIIALSIGERQFYSTSGLTSNLVYPSVTSREIKGVSTGLTTIELEAGGSTISTNNAATLSYWSNMQRIMQMSESIINNAPQITTLESTMLSGIMAQAYLFKAMALAELASAFEQVNLNTSTTDKVTFVGRAEVMTEVLRLLNQGLNEVNTTPPSATFTSTVTGADFDLKNTLYAMLARYNLMAGRYQDALTQANLVDLTKKSQFVYNTLTINPLYTVFGVTKSYRPRANFGLSADLFEAADQRLGFYLTTPTATVNTDVVATLSGFSAQTSPIPVYLTDEIKLIKAEAILRNNGLLADALTLINEVRTQTAGDPFGVNAGLPAYSGAISKDALLLEVYKQRCAELYLSGLKWEDTRRFGRPTPPTNNTESNRVFYPYPDQERLNNSNTPADPAI
ncbi:hypothetical protein ADIARSV_3678 [Arcticibacter svalbardensis MN12-7]|uniref:RagB/SusD domain-containing protein n=1 Tax=Arcticibacter svalbardensis MN12-7 TaxID=1150600 RepID=R9GN19_9SPHI|nr:RagB/SusD family nutrient uptake outer membrane protein [Arcticibacter svalbardensis]EOR93113.1 hypothetical protein ADIARSV_3678 [Arcticibacter svalbardensis MN12-7]